MAEVKYAPRTSTAAVAFAKSKVGSSYPKGWCQAWVVAEVFGTGGVGDYDGDRAADAEDGWKKAKAVGKVVLAKDIRSLMDIPKGVALYWSGGTNDNGHASVSAGNAKTYTTDLPYSGKIGLVDIAEIHQRWGLTFLGYVLIEGNGYTLTDRPTGNPPVAVWGKPETFVLGATGRDVVRLGERMIIHAKALGVANPYKFGPSSPITQVDVDFLAAIQEAWGDRDHDGYPGPLTFQRLEAEPSTKPEPRTITIPIMLMPLAGYNAAGQPGVTRWATNVKGALGLVTEHKPTLLGVTELSSKAPVEMKDAFDAGATSYARHGGSDGRYPYIRKSQVRAHVAHGTFTASAKLQLSGQSVPDDKQMGWRVDDLVNGARVVFGIAHSENQNGRDVRTGKNADVIRVEQAVEFAHKIDTLVDQHGGYGLLMGDFNSEDAVRERLVKLGWIACPVPGKATGWDHEGGVVADWIFVKVGALATKRLRNPYSDHTVEVGTWTFTIEEAA